MDVKWNGNVIWLQCCFLHCHQLRWMLLMQDWHCVTTNKGGDSGCIDSPESCVSCDVEVVVHVFCVSK